MEVSVIIPIYNSEKYIKKCVSSLLHQSFKDMEVILVDDGSTDMSSEICLELAKRHDNVIYCAKQNTGVSSTRNKGVSLANGKYVAFVDADDFVHKDMISVLYKSIDDVDISICGYYLYEHDIKRCRKMLGYDFIGDYSKFMKNFGHFLSPPLILGPCFKLFKKQIIIENKIEFPEDISFGEDALFVLEYLKYCDSIRGISECLYYYRQHGDKTLSKKFDENKIYIQKKIYEKMNEIGCEENASASDKWFVSSYDNYVYELVLSKLSYKRKRELFFETVCNTNIKFFYQKVKDYNFCALFTKVSIKTKSFFVLYLFIRTYNKLKKYYKKLLLIVFRLKNVKK